MLIEEVPAGMLLDKLSSSSGNRFQSWPDFFKYSQYWAGRVGVSDEFNIGIILNFVLKCHSDKWSGSWMKPMDFVKTIMYIGVGQI